MSLDISLNTYSLHPSGSGIFVRENGRVREISREEWDQKFPDREPVAMYTSETGTAWSGNITHNLHPMADAAGLDAVTWNVEPGTLAGNIVEELQAGLERLKENPDYYRQFDAPNKWGVYKDFVGFIEEYLNACKQYPAAVIYIDK